MGALISTPRSILNSLLPFTNPSTPLLQDLIHTAVLFLTLYFGPQLVDLYKSHSTPHPPADPIPDDPPDPLDNIPVDENLILQDSDDEGDAEPPPLAPTPPPGHFAQPPPPRADWAQDDQANGFAEPGPANPNINGGAERPRPTPQNRTIGAKKAKSLARKDQRRAYHEFHRQEAEIRRLQEAEGREEREALLAAEKARRAEVEREIKEQERVERERKKEEERMEAAEEQARRERVVRRVRAVLDELGAVDLETFAWEEGKDRLWVERLVRASGILSSKGKSEDSHTLITSGGWVVRVDAQLMAQAYVDAVSFGDENDGKVSFADMGTILEKAVRARVKAY